MLLLAVSAFLFDSDALTATTQTLMWVVIFFFASAGASAAYLTVSETWPIEIRSEAIAVFFAIGTIAGALGPAFYGALIGDGSDRTGLFIGYLVGAGIMVFGGVIEVIYRDRRRGQVAGGHHQAADRCGVVGSSRIAPIRKQRAPTSVPRLEISAFQTSPLAGTTYAATAETPKATEPSMFAAPIHQSRDFGCPSVMALLASIHASPLATRNAAEPSASGRHTRWSASAASRFMRTALPVLQLNHRVPANCTAQASQPTSRGAKSQKRRRSGLCSAGRPSTASRYWRNAADVKNTDPRKNVSDVARKPTASE